MDAARLTREKHVDRDLGGRRPALALAWLVSGVARGPDRSADGCPIAAYQIHIRYGVASTFCVCISMIMFLKHNGHITSNDH